MNNRPSDIVIENAEIWMQTRNFSGKKDKFGNSTPGFCVFIDPDLAETLKNDGWNVKYTRPREEGDMPRPYLSVSFNYGHENPRLDPRIWKVTSRNKILLDAETIGQLDSDEIATADLVIRPYAWNVNASSGIKAYVKELFVVIEESVLARKYFMDDQPPAPDAEEVPW